MAQQLTIIGLLVLSRTILGQRLTFAAPQAARKDLIKEPGRNCPGQSAEMCWRIVVVYKFWRILPGDFPGGFFWALFGALRKDPPFHGSRSSREIKLQNASCQMGGRKVTRR